MTKRSEGRDEAEGKPMRELVSVLQRAPEDRGFTAWELGHLDVLISRVLRFLGAD